MFRSPRSLGSKQAVVRALVAGGLIAAAAAPGAHAYVRGPELGQVLVTARPDLLTAKVVSASTTDLDPNTVQFCFRRNVTQVADRSFLVYSYDADRYMRSFNAEIQSNTKCVLANFGTYDVAQGTVAAVDRGAVNGGGGDDTEANPYASVPLDGGGVTGPQLGRTTGPDVLSATIDPAQSNEVTFTFDETLQPLGQAAPNTPFVDNDSDPANGVTNPDDDRIAAQFLAQPANGNDPIRGIDLLSQNGRQVKVRFAAAITAVRRFAYAGPIADTPVQIGDLNQEVNKLNGSRLSTPAPAGVATTQSTNRPVILDVTPAGARAFRIRYSAAVKEVPAQEGLNIYAVRDDAEAVAQPSIDPVPNDPNSVLATFSNDLVADTSAIVRIVDIGGGVLGNDANNTPSATSAFALGAANTRPGYTTGPDLLKAAFDRQFDRVTFTFDEPLSEFAGDGGAYDVLDGTGQFFAGSGSSATPAGSSSQVVFGAQGRNSIGASSFDSAARDRLGNTSPYGSVSYKLQPRPTPPPAGNGGGSTPPPPRQTTTPPSQLTPAPQVTQQPQPLPGRVRFGTRVTLKKSGPVFRRKYSGRIRSEGRGCKAGRRIVLKRRTRSGRTRTIARTFTKGDGTFSFERRRRPSGRVYAFVTERGGAAVFCKSGSSKRIKG